MSREWMIYGAYGYTGELVLREALRHGLRPTIAGRTEARLVPLAAELELDHRVFQVSDARSHIERMRVVLNCAGPFSGTAAPIVEACIERGAHYVDITGEISVFQFCHGLSKDAQRAGVVLCPGAGFDICPTDCLAALLKERLPDARRIDLAFYLGTRPSGGTARTVVQGIGMKGVVRRNHQLVHVASGHRIRRIPFPGGSRWAVTLPWADVFTVGISAGVPDCEVYAALPLPICLALRATSPLSNLLAREAAQRWLSQWVERTFSGGPDEQDRTRQRSELWGQATNDSGRSAVARMTTPNAYSLTADTAVAIVTHLLEPHAARGFMTPSMLMGADMITKRPGVEVDIESL